MDMDIELLQNILFHTQALIEIEPTQEVQEVAASEGIEYPAEWKGEDAIVRRQRDGKFASGDVPQLPESPDPAIAGLVASLEERLQLFHDGYNSLSAERQRAVTEFIQSELGAKARDRVGDAIEFYDTDTSEAYDRTQSRFEELLYNQRPQSSFPNALKALVEEVRRAPNIDAALGAYWAGSVPLGTVLVETGDVSLQTLADITLDRPNFPIPQNLTDIQPEQIGSLAIAGVAAILSGEATKQSQPLFERFMEVGEVAATTKEYPAPWLGGGRSIHRDAFGRFGSGSDAPENQPPEVSSLLSDTAKDLNKSLEEFREEITNDVNEEIIAKSKENIRQIVEKRKETAAELTDMMFGEHANAARRRLAKLTESVDKDLAKAIAPNPLGELQRDIDKLRKEVSSGNAMAVVEDLPKIATYASGKIAKGFDMLKNGDLDDNTALKVAGMVAAAAVPVAIFAAITLHPWTLLVPAAASAVGGTGANAAALGGGAALGKGIAAFLAPVSLKGLGLAGSGGAALKVGLGVGMIATNEIKFRALNQAYDNLGLENKALRTAITSGVNLMSDAFGLNLAYAAIRTIIGGGDANLTFKSREVRRKYKEMQQATEKKLKDIDKAIANYSKEIESAVSSIELVQ